MERAERQHDAGHHGAPVQQADHDDQRGDGNCVEGERSFGANTPRQRADTVARTGLLGGSVDTPANDEDVLGGVRADVSDEADDWIDREHDEKGSGGREVEEPRGAVRRPT